MNEILLVISISTNYKVYALRGSSDVECLRKVTKFRMDSFKFRNLEIRIFITDLMQFGDTFTWVHTCVYILPFWFDLK